MDSHKIFSLWIRIIFLNKNLKSGKDKYKYRMQIGINIKQKQEVEAKW